MLLTALLVARAWALDPCGSNEWELCVPQTSERVDCGLVPGESYRIGLNALQLPDGRVLRGWRNCRLGEGITFSMKYDEAPPAEGGEQAPPAHPQELQDPPPPPTDETHIAPEDVSQKLDSSAQASSAVGIASFLSKHPEVVLLEARITAACTADGSPDPIGQLAAEDLIRRIGGLGVQLERITVAVRPCSSTARGVRIEAVVVRTQK